MLTNDQVEHYREKGYLGIEGVFSAAEVAELARVTGEFVDQSREFTEHTDAFDLDTDFPVVESVDLTIERAPIVELEIAPGFFIPYDPDDGLLFEGDTDTAGLGDMVIVTVAPERVRPSIWIVATRSPCENASTLASAWTLVIRRQPKRGIS